MALLDVQDVRRSFGGLVAVDGVSFKVPAGQIKAVIGPNGAGKTTLVQPHLRPAQGRYRAHHFKDQPITRHEAVSRSLRAGMSRTFQTPSLFLQMNVLENVMVGCHGRTRRVSSGAVCDCPARSTEERSIRETALARLEYVGLAHLRRFSARAPGLRPTAAWWNWLARWRPTGVARCWTSRPAGSTPGKRKTSAA